MNPQQCGSPLKNKNSDGSLQYCTSIAKYISNDGKPCCAIHIKPVFVTKNVCGKPLKILDSSANIQFCTNEAKFISPNGNACCGIHITNIVNTNTCNVPLKIKDRFGNTQYCKSIAKYKTADGFTVCGIHNKAHDIELANSLASSNNIMHECTICLSSDDIVKTKLQCNHMFHKHCILHWIKSQKEKTCPLCREPIMIELNESYMSKTISEQEHQLDDVYSFIVQMVREKQEVSFEHIRRILYRFSNNPTECIYRLFLINQTSN